MRVVDEEPVSQVAILALPKQTVDGLVEVLALASEAYGLPYCWLHQVDGASPVGVVLTPHEFRRLREAAGEPLHPTTEDET